MLKTCQLVNILGGTVVYEATKTVMLSSVFFSPPTGKDGLTLVNFFFLMKEESLGHFSLITSFIDSNMIIQKYVKKKTKIKENG